MQAGRLHRIVILGSTGSIGAQTLDVVRRLAGRVEVVGLAAHRNTSLLARQAREFGVHHVCVADPTCVDNLRSDLAGIGAVRVVTGSSGLDEIASLPECDTVVVAVAGAIGIGPTQAAIRACKRIALASKEVLVSAGRATTELAREHGVEIVPIDSEHSALFQCLVGNPRRHVANLILTASGGPFRDWTLDQMREVTPEAALRHPTWNMGGLVTINSATLMNKGLEIIEAHWLFGVPVEDIEVVVHPQSIIHSLARFSDGSVLAQLGLPDMRLPIQYALLHPERIASGLPRFDPATCGPLTFAEPDAERFPALRLARDAMARGGTMPTVMNGANEAAVARFLERGLPFLGIMDTVERVMGEHDPLEPTIENVMAADSWSRERVRAITA
ncbi:MAG: 1-deoxy-D-xylulose-5-phosphate reductoisomerase [Armatimonadetes bacterium]|nr:1-deoxy-D-xylulose-5-phosphate reductoisomerase [Armatimonadota bacterium]